MCVRVSAGVVLNKDNKKGDSTKIVTIFFQFLQKKTIEYTGLLHQTLPKKLSSKRSK